MKILRLQNTYRCRIAATLCLALCTTSPAHSQLLNYPGGPTEHGSVIVGLQVSPEGKVYECSLAAPSGVESLDAGACDIGKQAFFHPATDESGNAVPSTQALTIHFIAPHVPQTEADLPIKKGDLTILYDAPRNAAEQRTGTHKPGQPMQRLPLEAQPAYPRQAYMNGEEGQVYVTIDVNEKGKPTRCSVVRTSDSAELDRATCKFAMNNLKFKPGTDSSGNKIGGVNLFSLNWGLKDSGN